ncbi:MAG: hypothetical protein WC563_14975 [Brevundimonas sp.]
MTSETIFAWIGRFSVGLTFVAGLLVWFGKTYIDRWLTKHFQGQLDDLKHIQAQEIERLKLKVAGALDRATKLHQREFEVLPKAWDLLSQALGAAGSVTASFKEGVDPGRMTSDELEAFLAKSPLEEHQKQAIRDAGRFEKPTLYQTYHEHHQFNAAIQAANEFHNYAIQFGIFIHPTIRMKLTEASQELQKALRAWKQILQMPDVKPWPVSESQEHVKAASELSKEIDALISARLWSAAKLDA